MRIRLFRMLLRLAILAPVAWFLYLALYVLPRQGLGSDDPDMETLARDRFAFHHKQQEDHQLRFQHGEEAKAKDQGGGVLQAHVEEGEGKGHIALAALNNKDQFAQSHEGVLAAVPKEMVAQVEEKGRQEAGGEKEKPPELKPKENEGGSKVEQQKAQDDKSVQKQEDVKREDEDWYEEKKEPEEAYAGVTVPKFVEWAPEDGPGEFGQGLQVEDKKLPPDERTEFNEGMKKNSFNQYASDRISIRRRLTDGRLDECKRQTFSPNLPEVSVILCFHNEAWTTLLRSVHSILERAPDSLVREVILVDDASTMEHLKRPLAKYFSKFPKVRIIRARKREGLIRARLIGYEASTAPVLVFLDSHIECYPGWLEPLIDRIAKDPKIVTYPVIDVISAHSLATGIRPVVDNVGIFRWSDLTFQWAPVQEQEKQRRKNEAEPIRSPTMPGGLYAIDKAWFTTLGTYDPGLDYWGGENLELSFKTWMCNGSLEEIPCSHVGHIFRASNPIPWTGLGNAIARNSFRVSEVWMDQYKFFFQESKTKMNFGDVSERKKLRQSLGCKDFHWYRQHVYPEMDVPAADYAGEIRNLGTNTCFDSMGSKSDKPQLFGCHGQGFNQHWILGNGHLSQDKRSLKVILGTLRYTSMKDAGPWVYTEAKQLYYKELDSCLAGSPFNGSVSMVKCAPDSKWQQWQLAKRDWIPPPL